MNAMGTQGHDVLSLIIEKNMCSAPKLQTHIRTRYQVFNLNLRSTRERALAGWRGGLNQCLSKVTYNKLDQKKKYHKNDYICPHRSFTHSFYPKKRNKERGKQTINTYRLHSNKRKDAL
jgi:hypothetical protein